MSSSHWETEMSDDGTLTSPSRSITPDHTEGTHCPYTGRQGRRNALPDIFDVQSVEGADTIRERLSVMRSPRYQCRRNAIGSRDQVDADIESLRYRLQQQGLLPTQDSNHFRQLNGHDIHEC